MAGGRDDWEQLINHQSSLLTETKDLVANTQKLLDQAESQSRQSRWTLFMAVLALLASILLPFIV